jgi:hypothetical protein
VGDDPDISDLGELARHGKPVQLRKVVIVPDGPFRLIGTRKCTDGKTDPSTTRRCLWLRARAIVTSYSQRSIRGIGASL